MCMNGQIQMYGWERPGSNTLTETFAPESHPVQSQAYLLATEQLD